jgi:hypothetical protein
MSFLGALMPPEYTGLKVALPQISRKNTEEAQEKIATHLIQQYYIDKDQRLK